jgi:hypothetical protein
VRPPAGPAGAVPMAWQRLLAARHDAVVALRRTVSASSCINRGSCALLRTFSPTGPCFSRHPPRRRLRPPGTARPMLDCRMVIAAPAGSQAPVHRQVAMPSEFAARNFGGEPDPPPRTPAARHTISSRRLSRHVVFVGNPRMTGAPRERDAPSLIASHKGGSAGGFTVRP